MAPLKFDGKAVIVTGSSAGIGQGIALLFGQQGALVTIHGRSLEGLQETKNLMIENGIQDSHIHLVQGDIEKAETTDKLINETVEKFGKIDVLVNNAGLGVQRDSGLSRDEDFDIIMGINLKSVLRLVNLATPYLEATKGNVVNISSICGLGVFNLDPLYSISKAALDHYMRHMAKDLGRRGIRMNNVNPGLIRTKFHSRLNLTVTFDQIAEGFVKSNVPLGRTGTPRDIADAVSFLASNEASYVTGTTMVVDGGALLGGEQ